MKKAPVFDYKEPFSAPMMIRELTKNVRLPFVMYAQDALVFLLTLFTIGGTLYFLFGFNQIVVCLTFGSAYGVMKLVDSFEPDGKKIHHFMKDSLVFYFSYGIGKFSLYQGNKIREDETLIYERKKIKELKIKKKE